VVALEGLPSLFSKDGKTAEVVTTEHERQIHELYAEIGRLTTQLTWLQKNLASPLPRAERMAFVERETS
jgi:putative transposase